MPSIRANKWQEVLEKADAYRIVGETKFSIGSYLGDTENWLACPWNYITRVDFDSSKWWSAYMVAEINGFEFSWSFPIGTLYQTHEREENDQNYGYCIDAGFRLYEDKLRMLAALLPDRWKSQLRDLVELWCSELQVRIDKMNERMEPLRRGQQRMQAILEEVT